MKKNKTSYRNIGGISLFFRLEGELQKWREKQRDRVGKFSYRGRRRIGGGTLFAWSTLDYLTAYARGRDNGRNSCGGGVR